MADSFSSKGLTTGDPGKRTWTPGDLILEFLEDLGEYDFKKFKNKLSDLPEEVNVPRGKLEKAEAIDTKELLICTYGKDRALQLTCEVLQTIKLTGHAIKLQERIEQNVKLKKIKCEEIFTEWRNEYMESAKEHCQRFKEYNSRLGEAIYLQDRYTELLLIKGPQNKEAKKYEITSLGRKHRENMKIKSSDKRSSTTIQALFDPDEHNFVPKIVVLQGPAGIGKTMTSKKIMMDWASGNLYGDKFNFLFYVSCREINKVTENINLAGLLSRACHPQCSDDHLEQLLKDFRNHRNLLFILDGFDELKWAVEKELEIYKDLSKETNKETLLQNLLRKKILKDSHLIITTRPLALEKLNVYIEDSRCVEILGFTGENRVCFLYSFFKNKDEADKVLSIIKNNDILLTMCAVPIICWIVCTVMKQKIKEDFELNPCKTATSIYLLYVKSLIKYHGRDLPVHTSLKKLCALAKEGVLNQQIMFEEEDLERHGLSVSEAESVFLNENIFHLNVDNQTCYSFIHLSVQEFFAALYYGMESDSGDNEDHSLPEICKGDSFSSLCKHHPHLTLAVQFLFGLLNQKVVKEFSKSTGIKLSFPYRFAIKKWFLGQSSNFNIAEAILCLYETQDEDFIMGIMTHISGLELGDLNDYSSSYRNCLEELHYCLNTCDTFKSLKIICLTMGPKYAEMLSPSLHKCQQLCFQHCRFSQKRQFQKKGGEDCLEKEKTFDFSNSFKTLANESENLSWLVNSRSKIEKLILFQCGLNESSCGSISSFMSSNKSLTTLGLGENFIYNSGAKILCDRIRHPGCNLQELELHCCGLSSYICDDLRSVLITSRSLTRLDLSSNYLENSGTTYLCEGLRDPRCILQELSLNDCGLTSLCCDDLRSVLITNRSLIKLDLSFNELENSGVDLVCDGLRDPRCSLHELKLDNCNLSSQCCAGFLSVLIANRFQTKLDLSRNQLEDSGVKCLCEGLRLPGCTLQELRLRGCGLTPFCCEDLHSVLISNKSLIKLDLSFNKIEDSGVKCLCEGLKSPDCMLQELRIYHCEATFLCSEDLLTVLRTNQTLTKLTATLDIDGEMPVPELHRICRPFLYLNCSYKWERYERRWMKIKYRRPNVPNWTGFCCCKRTNTLS